MRAYRVKHEPDHDGFSSRRVFATRTPAQTPARGRRRRRPADVRGGASASELVYQPINPAFGGNPFNGPFLIDTAKIQNGHNAKDRRSSTSGLSGISGLSDQEQFVRILQSRLLSDMASKVADAIFGENAQDSGEFRYGSQVVSFSRGVDSISIDIFNEQTGERTQISVPSGIQ